MSDILFMLWLVVSYAIAYGLGHKAGQEAGYKDAVKDCFGEALNDCVYPNPFTGEVKKEAKE